MFRILSSTMLCTLLLGCAQAPSSTNSSALNTLYDYQLYSPHTQPITLKQLVSSAEDADVILVGEWHTHPATHYFEAQLLHQLTVAEPKLALSMEQFSRDKQSIVNQYLDGEIGEQILKQKGNAWPNYSSDYRPLIEYAKTNNLDVIAANAPRKIVRCIGRKGTDYVASLPSEQQSWIATKINTEQSPYKTKFMGSMHHGDLAQNENQYAAQVTWDETMGESIVNYLNDHPDHLVMHIAGNFHVEDGLGIKASILRRNPDLNVLVISITSDPIEPKSDYQLQVLPMPPRYVQEQNRMAAYRKMMHHSATTASNSECQQ